MNPLETSNWHIGVTLSAHTATWKSKNGPKLPATSRRPKSKPGAWYAGTLPHEFVSNREKSEYPRFINLYQFITKIEGHYEWSRGFWGQSRIAAPCDFSCAERRWLTQKTWIPHLWNMAVLLHEVMGSNSMPVRIAHGDLTMGSLRLMFETTWSHSNVICLHDNMLARPHVPPCPTRYILTCHQRMNENTGYTQQFWL